MRGKKVLRLHIYVPPIGQKGPFHGLSDMAVFLYSRMSSEHLWWRIFDMCLQIHMIYYLCIKMIAIRIRSSSHILFVIPLIF